MGGLDIRRGIARGEVEAFMGGTGGGHTRAVLLAALTTEAIERGEE